MVLGSKPEVTDEDPIVREALRVYGRYQREIVEAQRLCPWAERARQDGRVRCVVRVDVAPDLVGTLATVDALAADATVDIGLVIYPRLPLGRLDFDRFVSALRDADAARGQETVRFAMAPFHYDAVADTKDGARLVPFLRRTPDPTIQLVRRGVLDAVRAGDTAHGTQMVDPASLDLSMLLAQPMPRSISDTIAAHNLETVTRLGVADVEAILADIKRDRDESYGRL